MRRIWLLPVVTAAACSGEVVGDTERDAPAPDAEAPAGAGPPGRAPSPGAPATPPAACAATLAPARVWRLSPAQYAATMSQLFGVEVARDALPGDGVTRGPFTEYEGGAEAAVVHDRLAVAYRDQAARAAAAVLPRAMQAHPCLGATPVPAGCGGRFVEEHAARAFRRPLEADEARRLNAFFDAAAGKWGGAAAARLTLQAILQSPRFLYRTELGAGKGRVSLTAHEMASQLAYLVTDGPPDAALLADAGANRLDAAALRRHAERLPDRARAGGGGQGRQAVPAWTPALQRALGDEVRAFAEREWDGALGPEGLFSAEHAYLTAAGAAHHGLPTSGLGSEPRRAALPPERRGLLGQAGVLAAISGEGHTSPTHRGLFFLNAPLCEAVPDPPPGAADQAAAKIVSPDAKATQREHFEYARRNAPECAGCHARFMEMGLGLERFDPVGRYRETEHGKPIDPAVTLSGFGELDGRHADGLALARAIAGSGAGRACFVAQAATYAFGRVVDPGEERCTVEPVVARARAGGLRLRDVLVELTRTEAFALRRGE